MNNVVNLRQKYNHTCHACGKNPDAMIMLKDSVWSIISDYKKELLCLLCMEKNLGRRLSIEDLAEAPINHANKILLGRIRDE